MGDKDKAKREKKLTMGEVVRTLETIREREEEIEEEEQIKRAEREINDEEREMRKTIEIENGGMQIKGERVYLEETKVDDRKFETELMEMSERKKEMEDKKKRTAIFERRG